MHSIFLSEQWVNGYLKTGTLVNGTLISNPFFKDKYYSDMLMLNQFTVCPRNGINNEVYLKTLSVRI